MTEKWLGKRKNSPLPHVESLPNAAARCTSAQGLGIPMPELVAPASHNSSKVSETRITLP